MNKYFIRFMALLLCSCLIADSANAIGSPDTSSFSPGMGTTTLAQSLFQEESLSCAADSAVTFILKPAALAEEIRIITRVLPLTFGLTLLGLGVLPMRAHDSAAPQVNALRPRPSSAGPASNLHHIIG